MEMLKFQIFVQTKRRKSDFFITKPQLIFVQIEQVNEVQISIYYRYIDFDPILRWLAILVFYLRNLNISSTLAACLCFAILKDVEKRGNSKVSNQLGHVLISRPRTLSKV